VVSKTVELVDEDDVVLGVLVTTPQYAGQALVLRALWPKYKKSQEAPTELGLAPGVHDPRNKGIVLWRSPVTRL
jgi:hypothetical protein